MDTKAPTTYMPLVLSDEYCGFPSDQFPLPEPCYEFLDRVLIPQGMIVEQTDRVVKQLYEDWDGRPLLLIMVMNGAARFGELVIKAINKNAYQSDQRKPYQIAYLQCINYAGDKQLDASEIHVPSTFPSFEGKHVVFVEDIVDTGVSMCKLLSWAISKKAISAKCFTMTTKRTTRSNGYIPNYSCFEIFDHWIVGFGLDYNNHFRHFDHIYVLADKGQKELNQSI